MSEQRKRLLLELEHLVGNECYNSNTQNWGPGGVFEGWGRDFRYPIRFVDEDGEKIERRNPDFELPEKVARTGYYAFGANQLQIIRALDKVLAHLEQNYGLNVPR